VPVSSSTTLVNEELAIRELVPVEHFCNLGPSLLIVARIFGQQPVYQLYGSRTVRTCVLENRGFASLLGGLVTSLDDATGLPPASQHHLLDSLVSDLGGIGSLLDGLHALLGSLARTLQVVLRGLKSLAQRLLVERQSRVKKLRVRVRRLLVERLECLPLALALLLYGLALVL
jgi:hypothetical protein